MDLRAKKAILVLSFPDYFLPLRAKIIILKVMKLEKIGRYPFLAEPFHCDFSHRLQLGHLGNHLLNAADFHSNDRDFGMNYLNSIGKTWVLSRLAIEIYDMPRQYDRFFVETWVESAMRYFTNRNFCITGEKDGLPKVYGYGRSIWAMIDTETRQPCNLLDIRDGELAQWVEKEKENPMEKLSRVKISDQAQLVRTIDTYYNDIDINGHVNSVKYIEHTLDLWPLEWYRRHPVRRFDIAYVAECHQGDRLSFYLENSAPEEYLVRICKDDNVEVARCRVLFTV